MRDSASALTGCHDPLFTSAILPLMTPWPLLRRICPPPSRFGWPQLAVAAQPTRARSALLTPRRPAHILSVHDRYKHACARSRAEAGIR